MQAVLNRIKTSIKLYIILKRVLLFMYIRPGNPQSSAMDLLTPTEVIIIKIHYPFFCHTGKTDTHPLETKAAALQRHSFLMGNIVTSKAIIN